MTEGGIPRAADMIDEWFAYRLAYKREPESWRHFRYGMEHLGRDRAQRQLDALATTRTAQDVRGEQYEKLHRTLAAEAGHTRMM